MEAFLSKSYTCWFIQLQESYEVFAALFDEIVAMQHGGYKKSDKHKTDLNPENFIGSEDLDEKYVISCRIRTGRSIKGYCLPPFCTRAERRAVEKVIINATEGFKGEFKGDFKHGSK